MRCRYCRERGGILATVCRDCKAMVEAVGRMDPGGGFRTLLDVLLATGASEGKIRKFLEADAGGQGSLRDRLTARMTNELAQELGQPSQMAAGDVERIRKRESTEKR